MRFSRLRPCKWSIDVAVLQYVGARSINGLDSNKAGSGALLDGKRHYKAIDPSLRAHFSQVDRRGHVSAPIANERRAVVLADWRLHSTPISALVKLRYLPTSLPRGRGGA